MVQDNEYKLLKIVILAFGIISLIYGFLFMIVPGWYTNLMGASPVPLVYIRWPGGVLIALGLGACKYYKNPAKGEVFAFTIAIAPIFHHRYLMRGSSIASKTSDTRVPTTVSVASINMMAPERYIS